MNRSLSLKLIVGGILLAILSLLTHYFAPALALPTLIAGLAGGALCVLWGALGLLGHRCKGWSILTLILIAYVMLSQMVLVWTGADTDVPGKRTAAVLITAMFAFSIGMLINLAYAGVLKTRPTHAAERAAQNAAGSGAKSNAAKHP